METGGNSEKKKTRIRDGIDRKNPSDNHGLCNDLGDLKIQDIT